MKTLVVKIGAPYGQVPTRALERYVREAVTSWSGQLRPPGAYDVADEGDPCWGLGAKHVTVKAVKS